IDNAFRLDSVYIFTVLARNRNPFVRIDDLDALRKKLGKIFITRKNVARPVFVLRGDTSDDIIGFLISFTDNGVPKGAAQLDDNRNLLSKRARHFGLLITPCLIFSVDFLSEICTKRVVKNYDKIVSCRFTKRFSQNAEKAYNRVRRESVMGQGRHGVIGAMN